ncbi:conserved hypothetical protein [Leishmania major strain Friedlin]|uniref:Uncharacterized protein n=1 Tax=Leishmania major TaxID=5664 RepID=E9AFH9_LEIMA|nr:conserved hypothetical protein [Leishmania major strain Friedlin]CAG9582710.1 hypothetical_protein_-_conserved [Leishmania major strain Friedlin]CBZ12983.1 conserved hypothetical protein [Leishmania major strain Friedlin]|eukprot:XP_003722749.1 conserved hypothetical protein [Leishmania major strain Friedlin]
MSSYLAARRDDERFTVRLEEVNKEMDGLLLKTSRTRHELDRSAAEVHMGVPLHFHPCDVAGRVHLAPSDPAGSGPGRLPARDDLARSLVLAELSQWSRSHLPSLVARLVEDQVQQQLLSLRDSAEEVRARQAKVEKAARDAAEQVRAHRADMHAAFSAAREETQRDMEEHQRTVKRQLAAWGEELRRVREDVLTWKQQSTNAGDRQEQRISEALQRQQAHVQEAFETLECEMQRWRQTTSRAVHKEAEELRAQHHALEHLVAQIQGMMTSTADMVAHCAAETQRLMEHAVSRSSEVRVCRRDVNRLEMLVRCSSLQTVLPTASTGSNGVNDNSTASPAASVVLNRLTPEMARFSDSLHAIVARIDGLDRDVRQLEMAVTRGTTASCGQSSYHGSMRVMDEESLYGRNFPSTRRPSYSHLSNATGLRGHPASSGFARMPSLLGCDESANVNPTHSGAAANKTGATCVALVSSAQPVGAGGAPGRGHSGAAGLGAQPSLTPLMSASPPSAMHHPSKSHLSSSSLRFEGDASDSHPMPAVVSESHSAPHAGINEVILRGVAVEAGAQRPPQHRAPPGGIIPVETGESDTWRGVAAKPTAAKSAARSTSLPEVSVDASQILREDALHSLTHQRNVSSRSASSSLSAGNADATFLVQRPCSSLAESDAVSVAEEGALPTHSGANHEESPVVATPHSPVDSYVSDTPAADLDDSKANSASVSKSDTREAARYTPAQANDSESERDNQVIVRSALD